MPEPDVVPPADPSDIPPLDPVVDPLPVPPIDPPDMSPLDPLADPDVPLPIVPVVEPEPASSGGVLPMVPVPDDPEPVPIDPPADPVDPVVPPPDVVPVPPVVPPEPVCAVESEADAVSSAAEANNMNLFMQLLLWFTDGRCPSTIPSGRPPRHGIRIMPLLHVTCDSNSHVPGQDST